MIGTCSSCLRLGPFFLRLGLHYCCYDCWKHDIVVVVAVSVAAFVFGVTFFATGAAAVVADAAASGAHVMHALLRGVLPTRHLQVQARTHCRHHRVPLGSANP